MVEQLEHRILPWKQKLTWNLYIIVLLSVVIYVQEGPKQCVQHVMCLGIFHADI